MTEVFTGGKSVTVGFRYYMSVHQAICRGPVDSLLEVRVGDVSAWPEPGQPGVTETSSTAIQRPNLFGGDKKEGGVSGIMQVLMGAADQIAPPALKALLPGRSSEFRGIVSIFFDGLICSINPYPKPWMFRVSRIFKGWDGEVWYPEKAEIFVQDNDALIRGMNPAHILYECCTNRVWGRGLARELIDDAAFRRAADTLYSEGFGLNLKWAREDDLDKFVQNVIDHIGAAVDINRETGLVRLKLIRDDYNVEDLPLFEYDSGLLDIEEDETSSKNDVVNEIVINFYSQWLNQKQQVRAHNLASFQASGNFKSISTDYVGISSRGLALRVLERDLKANALSGQRYKLKLDRRAWRIGPADVIRVRAPDRGLGDLVLRVGKFSDTSNVDGEITIDAVPDVFGLAAASFIKSEDAQWKPPNKDALPVLFARLEEASYRDVFRGTITGTMPDIRADTGFLASMAGKPSGLSMSYDLMTQAEGADLSVRSSESFAPVGTLVSAIKPYDTTIALSNSVGLDQVKSGDSIFIGDEIARVDNIISPNSFAVARGCVDTIPAAHSAGTVCRFPERDMGSDGRQYTLNENAYAKFITVTSSQRLEENVAALLNIKIAARAYKPYPPGNFRVDGKLPTSDVKVGTSFSLSWAHRDRLIQQDKLFDNSAANFGPEAGTSYTLRFYRGATLVRTEESIQGTNFSYTLAMDVADGSINPITVELESVRDGVASWQRYRAVIARS